MLKKIHRKIMNKVTKGELGEGLKNKTWKFYPNGHLVSNTADRLIDRKDWDQTTIGTSFYSNLGGEYCFLCNERDLQFIPLKNNIISLVNPEDVKKEFKLLNEIPPCKYSYLIQQNKLISRVEFPTGKIIFRNYFETDDLYETKNCMFELNSMKGRNNLMQYLASKNVGYGQMGNMGLTVYSNENDEIILGVDVNDLDDYSDTKYNKGHKQAYWEIIENGKFEAMGYISLTVWRWQCADFETLDEYPDDKITSETLDEENIVICNVKSGTWEIEHYYEIGMKLDNEFIYSRLKLIK